jgi:teichuronic acid exporter
MCCGQVISSLICLIVNIYYTGKLIQLGFFAQMSDLIPILLQSLVMGGIVFGIIRFIPSHVLQLFIGITVGAIIYLLMSVLFKSKEYRTFLELFVKKRHDHC